MGQRIGTSSHNFISALEKKATTMLQSIDDAGRGAFVLNNLGVELLLKQCYVQAHETLRDAALVVMVIARSKQGGVIDSDECNVADRLVDAYRRFSKPSSLCSRQIDFIHSRAPAALSPIVLDAEEFDLHCERDLGIVASVVAYNSALSHLRLSEFSQYARESGDLRFLAQRFFQTAYLLMFMSLPEIDGRCTSLHVIGCVIRVIAGLIESVKSVPGSQVLTGAEVEQLGLVVSELRDWYNESGLAVVGAAAA
jgi:hypothetical protein